MFFVYWLLLEHIHFKFRKLLINLLNVLISILLNMVQQIYRTQKRKIFFN